MKFCFFNYIVYMSCAIHDKPSGHENKIVDCIESNKTALTHVLMSMHNWSNLKTQVEVTKCPHCIALMNVGVELLFILTTKLSEELKGIQLTQQQLLLQDCQIELSMSIIQGMVRCIIDNELITDLDILEKGNVLYKVFCKKLSETIASCSSENKLIFIDPRLVILYSIHEFCSEFYETYYFAISLISKYKIKKMQSILEPFKKIVGEAIKKAEQARLNLTN